MNFSAEELQELLNAGFDPMEINDLVNKARPTVPVKPVGKISKPASVTHLPNSRGVSWAQHNAYVNTLNNATKPQTRGRNVASTPQWSSNLNKQASKNIAKANRNTAKAIRINAAADPAKTPKKSNLGDAFDKAKGIGSDIFGDIMFNVDNFFNPNAGGKISYGLGTAKTGGLGKAGLNLGKHNLGKFATGASAVMQSLDAIGGFSEMSDLNADADTLTNQILASASGNPLLHSYLTSDDLALLGKLQRGGYDATGDFGDVTSNLGNLLSGTLSGVASGALGGIPGMVVGGIGGLINSGIDNVNSATTNNTARLEALYQNLLNAEQQYKSMRRPNFTGLGIQQRYQDMYA